MRGIQYRLEHWKTWLDCGPVTALKVCACVDEKAIAAQIYHHA